MSKKINKDYVISFRVPKEVWDQLEKHVETKKPKNADRMPHSKSTFARSLFFTGFDQVVGKEK